MRAALLLAAFLSCAQAWQALAQPADRPWRVIILIDGDASLPAFALLDRGIRSVLTEPGRHPVDVFSESLDMLRFPETLFEREMVALLARKYAALPPDAIVTTGPAALDFAERHATRLWPQTRIAFMDVPPELLRGRRLWPGTTGLLRRFDLAGTAELALRLNPEMRRLVVISGSGDFDRRMAELAKAELAGYARGIALEYWQDAPIDELLRRAAQLGSNDAMLYLVISRDANGRTFVPAEATKLLAEASGAPLYGPIETYVGRGAVAGRVYSYQAEGRRMAELVYETLAARPGPPPPLAAVDQSMCIADARQLERYSLKAEALPPGCEVRYVQHTLWRDYREYALGGALIILVQSALLIGLLVQRRGRVRAEGELRDRRAELAQASRLALAGELTASIAHEINQPLAAILTNVGAAELLLERDPSASQELREILADIVKADRRASDVIRRVRSLVTVRQGERETVDVNSMVRDVLGFFAGEAERREVRVQTFLEPQLPALQVDRVQVQQALVNLCVNALEAMADTPADRRRLEVRTARRDGGVEIAVADGGPGIEPAHLPKLFDSFFTTKAQGTGLGLSITRSIVEAHAGRLSAENRDEGGARFLLFLPVAV